MASTSHPQLLDRIYSGQKHIYDLTRKYFLFGRDTLLYQLQVNDHDRILEVGTGTARNLLWLSRRYPSAQLYGIDASREMLKKAQTKIEQLGKQESISLGFGLAESFTTESTFEKSEQFDIIFFSYSLSMMPDWRGALQNALTLLAPGGELWIVDFWDQAGYPHLFQKGLSRFLEHFHVRHDPELIPYCERCAKQHKMEIKVSPVGRRYAVLAQMKKSEQ